MNQDNDKRKAPDIDPQVSDHYTALADEKTPVDLDRAVLREAARAVRADNRRGSFGAWFRPVAFMAMVGLSLAIILDLTDMSIFDPAADMPFESAPPAPVQAPAKNAADDAGRHRSQTSLNEFKRQQKGATPRASTADAPDATGDDAGGPASPAAVIESPQPERGKLMRMQSGPAPADTRSQGETVEDYAAVGDALAAEAESAGQRVRKLEQAAAEANLPSQAGTAAQLSTSSLSQVAPPACSDEQRADVESWWKCIATLRQSGQLEAADSELERLQQTYRNFAPAE